MKDDEIEIIAYYVIVAVIYVIGYYLVHGGKL